MISTLFGALLENPHVWDMHLADRSTTIDCTSTPHSHGLEVLHIPHVSICYPIGIVQGNYTNGDHHKFETPLSLDASTSKRIMRALSTWNPSNSAKDSKTHCWKYCFSLLLKPPFSNNDNYGRRTGEIRPRDFPCPWPA